MAVLPSGGRGRGQRGGSGRGERGGFKERGKICLDSHGYSGYTVTGTGYRFKYNKVNLHYVLSYMTLNNLSSTHKFTVISFLRSLYGI